jgi:hypothetical protein
VVAGTPPVIAPSPPAVIAAPPPVAPAPKPPAEEPAAPPVKQDPFSELDTLEAEMAKLLGRKT